VKYKNVSFSENI